MQVFSTELAALLKRNFPYAHFLKRFPRICSFELLWISGSERLYKKGYLLKTMKTAEDQKQTFACAQQNS